jgi:hypothetical protein
MVGLRGLGHLESAAAASYMDPAEMSSADGDDSDVAREEDFSVDIVAESDPEDDETLRELVANMHAEELQASGVDE